MSQRPSTPESLRERMVVEQLVGRGIRDPEVLAAFRRIPRHEFMAPGHSLEQAYEDRPHPIGEGQTISQPFVVAWMLELLDLQPRDKALEIGTGSGYATALLAELVSEVVSVERIPELYEIARRRFEGSDRVRVILGDGSLGAPEEAPFDAILVSASAPAVPEALVRQLRADGGRMVVPVGEPRRQKMVQVRMDGGRPVQTAQGAVAFVRLIGREGWES